MTAKNTETDETQLYRLSVEQKYDPVRAVKAYRWVEAISDPEEREHARRHLTGVILPVNPADKDAIAFVTASKAIADRIEAAESDISGWVENYYAKTAPAYKPAYLLFGAEPRFRKVVARALAAYSNFFSNDVSTEPGITHTRNERWWIKAQTAPVVISTSRPGHRWLIDGNQTLDSVYKNIKKDIWCDIDLSGIGYCIDRMRKDRAENNLGSYIDAGVIPNRSSVLPFQNGNTLILVHVCWQCWQTYVLDQKINIKACEVVEPFDDGFGSVGGPINQSEYLWDRRAVKQTADEFENRNKRRPNLAELEKALQGVSFIGAKNPTRKRTTMKNQAK